MKTLLRLVGGLVVLAVVGVLGMFLWAGPLSKSLLVDTSTLVTIVTASTPVRF